MSDTNAERIDRDTKRALRLLELIKVEMLEMNITTRLAFAKDLVTYLKPEMDVLKQKGELPCN